MHGTACDRAKLIKLLSSHVPWHRQRYAVNSINRVGQLQPLFPLARKRLAHAVVCFGGAATAGIVIEGGEAAGASTKDEAVVQAAPRVGAGTAPGPNLVVFSGRASCDRGRAGDGCPPALRPFLKEVEDGGARVEREGVLPPAVAAGYSRFDLQFARKLEVRREALEPAVIHALASSACVRLEVAILHVIFADGAREEEPLREWRDTRGGDCRGGRGAIRQSNLHNVGTALPSKSERLVPVHDVEAKAGSQYVVP